MSGADREIMEGVVALFAVVVLSYVGLRFHDNPTLQNGRLLSILRFKNSFKRRICGSLFFLIPGGLSGNF